MFNLQGSEIIFILLIALVVLGPEKLPGAIRRMTSLYAELRKLSSGFQEEFKSVLDEPMREMKSTADLMKNAADPKRIFDEAEREAELDAAAAKKAKQASDTTSAMEAAGAAHLAEAAIVPTAEIESGVDAFDDPVDVVAEDLDAVADEAKTVDHNGDESDDESVAPVEDETRSVPRLSSVDLDDGENDTTGDEPEEKSA